MTSFKDAKVEREQYISKEDKKRIDFYKKNFKKNSGSAFERKPKKSKVSIKPTKSSGAFDREVKKPLVKKNYSKR